MVYIGGVMPAVNKSDRIINTYGSVKLQQAFYADDSNTSPSVHTFLTYETENPTCTEDGYKDRLICRGHCGQVLSQGITLSREDTLWGDYNRASGLQTPAEPINNAPTAAAKDRRIRIAGYGSFPVCGL